MIGSDLWEYAQQWKKIAFLAELFAQRLQTGRVIILFLL